MRGIVAALMILTAPAALAYTADELAQKNVEAKGGSTSFTPSTRSVYPASFSSTATP